MAIQFAIRRRWSLAKWHSIVDYADYSDYSDYGGDIDRTNV